MAVTKKEIVVVGAGVTGLTTALELSKTGLYNVTIVAKHMPGDYDIEYASPWAGANFLPVSLEGTKAADREAATWKELYKLARSSPGAGVHIQHTTIKVGLSDMRGTIGKWFAGLLSDDPWFRDFPNFSYDYHPPDSPSANKKGSPHHSTTKFDSVCINTAVYLPWLVSQCLEHNVKLRRAVLGHIEEARFLSSNGKLANLIVNCTGLGAAKLGGVEDKDVFPARGQIVLVRNSAKGQMITATSDLDPSDETCYVMERAAGGGTILGGSYQVNNWSPDPDPKLAIRIMQRAARECPELTQGQGIEALDVVRHAVGLRPLRKNGVRLCFEEVGDAKMKVVHNYGHGGTGYQSSYGCAQEAVKLVREAFS